MLSRTPIRKRAIASAMLVLMLFASASPALSRMSCLSSGKSVYTITDLHSCCLADDNGQQATVQAQCCTFGKVKAQQPDMAIPQLPAVPAMELLSTFGFSFSSLRAEQLILPFAQYLRPPPLSVPDLLALICVLRA